MPFIDNYGRIVSYDELYHHGILGQKWGVRHDHYPLDASQHTAAEKKAGWIKSIGATDYDGNGRYSRKERKTDKYKAKESYKADKRYAKEEKRRGKKLDKAKAKQEKLSEKKKALSEEATNYKNAAKQQKLEDRLKKINSSVNKMQALKDGVSKRRALELDTISKMTPKDVKKEKKQYGKTVAQMVGLAPLARRTANLNKSNERIVKGLRNNHDAFGEENRPYVDAFLGDDKKKHK